MSVEHIDFYRARRAKPGQSARKEYLLNAFREAEASVTHQAEASVTHYIIAFQAGDKEAAAARNLVELERHRVAQLLLSITKD